MLEPTVTPLAQTTPNYWLDQIDVAIELPMGPQGEQGPPGTAWLVGPGDPPQDGTYEEGTLFLSGSGIIYRYEDGEWQNTGVDLLPPAGDLAPHDHAYLPLAGGTLTGLLKGTDADFTGNVTVPTPNAPAEAVNVEYLTGSINNLNLQRFLGDSLGNAIKTAGSWNSGQGQAIYQQVPNGLQAPPGVTGPTVGITMRQSGGNLTQLICDVTRNLWFVRTQVGNSWGQWSTLSPIVSTSAPVDPPSGPPVPNGTIWIQTDATVTP